MRNSKQRAVRRLLGTIAACLAAIGFAASAQATSITLGGTDVLTEYTASNGVLTFGAEPGLIDDTGGIAGLAGADVHFEAMLSDFRFNGSTAYNAATDFVNQANFISTGNNALVFVDNGTVLLAFAIAVSAGDLPGTPGGLKVSSSGVAFPPNDPDGFLVIGNLNNSDPDDLDGNDCASANFGLCRNELVLVGGSLADEVGGIGSIAHLHVRLESPTPAILTSGDLNGYFGSDFTAGDGLQNAATVWDLTIVAIPEPSTASLLALGLLAIAGLARRRGSA